MREGNAAQIRMNGAVWGCPLYQCGCADWGGLRLVFTVDHILTDEILVL